MTPNLSLFQELNLQALLREADPSALLVPSRLLRRVIKKDREMGGIGLQVPHRKTYTIRRDALLAIADPDELEIKDKSLLPEHLLLIAYSESWRDDRKRDQTLLEAWRLLFHASLDRALGEESPQGNLDEAQVRALIQRLGAVEMEEAFRVLRQENLILPPGDLRGCFLEFVAFFFELRYFAPHLLSSYFPGLEHPERAETLLLELVDAKGLFSKTRLPGAPEPLSEQVKEEATDLETLILPGSDQDPEAVRKWLDGAEAARRKGNLARSAILRWRAMESAPLEEKEKALSGAKEDLKALAVRLQKALGLEEARIEDWCSALLPLLHPASHGLWPSSRRLLYDLQKVCVDAERPLYAVDLVEWICSFFKKPIKRPVPLQGESLLVKHLRSAAKRLARARIGTGERDRLADLLRDATHLCEKRLRHRVGPLLRNDLLEVGFQPANQVENLALEKMVEELLDRILERGFINMGDLRDAISRNQLKMPDVSPSELIVGDRLLKANRKLALSLDGVYQRGEFYLRWLQRLSSLLFGTFFGRWLVLYLVLPFGGAVATAIFAQEMLHLGQVHVHIRHGPDLPALPGVDPRRAYAGQPGHHLRIHARVLYPILAGLGLFYLLLIHWPSFRSGTWFVTKKVWRGVEFTLWDIPVGFFNLPAVRAFLDSPPLAFFRRRLMRPLLTALVVTLGWYLVGFAGYFDDLAIALGTFALALFFFNSRLGRLTEEAISDWLVRNWDWLRVDVLPGALRFVIFFFRMVLDRLERLIYTVDEWLRFRPGEGRLSLLLKPVLGLIWFFLTYLIRVIINLFVEPTVNPVKHFPAVTVGAKLMIPLFTMWALPMTEALKPILGLALAGAITGTVFLLIPGIFGFAVWEFKENWKLYKANRAKVLKPVMIGHHGETMLRFMKPGFHSGTLPKLFAKLRQAQRRGDGGRAHKQTENLHHVEESLRHFVCREFVALLTQSNSWGGLKLEVGEIHLATNRIQINFHCPELGAGPLNLAFEEKGGVLIGCMKDSGWNAKWNAEQEAAFRTAVAGFYKLAGVDLAPDQMGPISWDEWVATWEKDKQGQMPVLAV